MPVRSDLSVELVDGFVLFPQLKFTFDQFGFQFLQLGTQIHGCTMVANPSDQGQNDG